MSSFAFFTTVAGYPWAGSEALWAETAQRLQTGGHAVTAMVHPDMRRAAALADLEKSGARILVRKNLAASWRLRSLQARLAGDAPRLYQGAPDLVAVSCGGPWDFGWIPGLSQTLQARDVPYVLIIQFAAEAAAPSAALRAQARSLYQKAAAVVFVSEHNRRLVQRQLGLGLSNAHIIPNPVLPALRGRAPLPGPGDPRGAARLASVARLECLWKGQDLLLEILAAPAWRQRNWRLRLYGQGPDQEFLAEQIARHHLRDRVELAGHAANIEALWREEELLVLPSHGEGLPLALLEAMACGRPAVVTDVGGNAEMITEGENGFLAEAPTLRSFGAALERAWEARGQWQALGENAHARVQPLIALDPAAELSALFENILLHREEFG